MVVLSTTQIYFIQQLTKVHSESPALQINTGVLPSVHASDIYIYLYIYIYTLDDIKRQYMATVIVIDSCIFLLNIYLLS